MLAADVTKAESRLVSIFAHSRACFPRSISVSPEKWKGKVGTMAIEYAPASFPTNPLKSPVWQIGDKITRGRKSHLERSFTWCCATTENASVGRPPGQERTYYLPLLFWADNELHVQPGQVLGWHNLREGGREGDEKPTCAVGVWMPLDLRKQKRPLMLPSGGAPKKKLNWGYRRSCIFDEEFFDMLIKLPLLFPSQGCGARIVTEGSGELTSPNYPHAWEQGGNCSWIITGARPSETYPMQR